MGHCLIISGGKPSKILSELTYFDFVIACDRGYEYALDAKIVPDIILGDFDSLTQKVPEGNNVVILPTEKDDTDTVAALRIALDMVFDQITLTCALGNRFDHSFANLQALAFGTRRGAVCRIVEDDTEITVTAGGSLEFEKKSGYSISLFALSDRVEGLTVEGAKYSLCKATLTNTFPIGVSNEWKNDTVKISFESGIICAVLSKLEEGETV